MHDITFFDSRVLTDREPPFGPTQCGQVASHVRQLARWQTGQTRIVRLKQGLHTKGETERPEQVLQPKLCGSSHSQHMSRRI
jgi:hypothetical protein